MTAKELLISKFGDTTDSKLVKQVSKVLVEFAKIHVEAALKAASEKWEANYKVDEHIGVIITIKKESILNAYPLENIK